MSLTTNTVAAPTIPGCSLVIRCSPKRLLFNSGMLPGHNTPCARCSTSALAGYRLTLFRTVSREFAMIMGRGIVPAAFTAMVLLAGLGGSADAAQCGSSAGGFESWKQEFAAEAK